MILLAASIVAYAYFNQTGLTLRFSEQQLEQRLQQHFPYQKRTMGILQFELNQPDVEFSPVGGRISITMQTTLEISAVLRRDGVLRISGVPSYQSGEGAFYLSSPRIDQFTIEGLAEKYSNMASSAISGVVATLYANKPIYRLDTQSSNKQKITKLVLRDIRITENYLVAVLGKPLD